MIDSLWDRYFELKSFLKNGKSIEEDLLKLSDKVHTTLMVAESTPKDEQTLHNIFYHCQETLMMEYGIAYEQVVI